MPQWHVWRKGKTDPVFAKLGDFVEGEVEEKAIRAIERDRPGGIEAGTLYFVSDTLADGHGKLFRAKVDTIMLELA